METAKATLQEGEVSKDQKWYWYADGKGHKIKVVNLDNEENCPKTGVVVVEALKKKNYDADRKLGITVSCTKDKATGVYWGIPLGIDNVTNQIKWMPIDLQTVNLFDRNVEAQAHRAAIVLHSPIVEGSPNYNYRYGIFRIHDQEKAAMQEIKRIKDGRKAIEIAMGLYGEELINMGRNLGVPVESTSISILESEVLKRAEKEPKEFLRIWENPHREFITILKRAIENGTIEVDPIKGHLFNGVPIGDNEAQVVDYMSKHRDIAASVDFKSKAKQSETLKAMAKTDTNNISADDQGSELARLKKELADLKAVNEELATTAIKQSISEEITPDKEELAALKLRAKDLGIKGAHMYTKVEQIPDLRKKIEEAEKVTQ